MGKIKNTKLIIGLSLIMISFILFIALAILTKLDKVNSFNNSFYTAFVSNTKKENLTKFFKVFTYLGNFFVLLIISLCFLFKKQKKDAIFLVLALIFVSILTFLIKYIIKNPRPEGVALIEESGYSFPSAHTSLTATTLTLMAYFLCKQTRKSWLKILIWIVSIILIFSVCYSRIYLGVHFFTDIIAGLLIAVIIVTLFIMLYNLKPASSRAKPKE